MTVPVPILNVALDPASPATFTDLSDRIIGTESLTVDCGRDDPLDVFAPGTLRVVLDNDDRALDPMNAAGLVYTLDGQGVPGCAVTLDLSFGGTTERRFTGRLSGDCWAGAGTPRYFGSPRGKTVVLEAVDRLAWSGDLPSDAWHIMLNAMTYVDAPAPGAEWWLPMDVGFPVLDNLSEVPNRAPGGGHATLEESNAAVSRPFEGNTGRHVPALKLAGGHKLRSPASGVMPAGDSDDLTVAMFWESSAALAATEQAVVLRMEFPGGVNTRWEVIVDDAGEVQVSTYDSGGTLIDTDTVDRTGTGITRWDDGQNHLVLVRINSGVLDVRFGGASLVGGTISAAATVYESDLLIGPSDQDCVVDELAVWRGALATADLDGMVLAGALIVNPWHGDDWLGTGTFSRLQRWFQAVGIEPNADDTDGFRVPSDDPDGGFWGLGTTLNAPGNLAEALRQTVGPDGSVWVNTDGFFVVRTVEALTAGGGYDAHYVTPVATFTDATSLGADEYRHAGIRFTGIDESQVVNRAEVSFSHLVDFGPPLDSFVATIAPESTTTVNGLTSQQTYGRKVRSETLDWYGWERAASLADSLIARYAFPLPKIDALALDATGDTDLTTWLCFGWELENAVNVEWTDGGITRSIDGLNIQAVRLSLTSTTFVAELKLAQS